jgi:hypothetical protein
LWDKKTQNLDPGILKVKLFPHSSIKTNKLRYENAQKHLKSWFNRRASFWRSWGNTLFITKKIILDLNNKRMKPSLKLG